MKRREAPEMSNEQFDEWMAACDRHDAVAAAADEVGGPRMSLVPIADRDAPWPTDLLPPAPDADDTHDPAPGAKPTHKRPSAAASGTAAADDPGALTPTAATPGHPLALVRDPLTPPATPYAPAETTDTSTPAAEPFDGVALPDSRKRLAGWSAERQRLFLTNLAETGSVHLASATARISARSAYRLRARSPQFAAAWDTAEQLAVGRLSALAFDRAINGRTEQVWEHGDLILEKRVPSDRILMWLLARLDPRRFAAPSEQRPGAADPQAEARAAFGGQLDAVADLPSE